MLEPRAVMEKNRSTAPRGGPECCVRVGFCLAPECIFTSAGWVASDCSPGACPAWVCRCLRLNCCLRVDELTRVACPIVTSSAQPTPESGHSERNSRAHLARPGAVQVDARKVVGAFTVLWAVATLTLIPFWCWLGRHDHRLWFWTCLCGTLLGVAGWILLAKHRREGRTL